MVAVKCECNEWRRSILALNHGLSMASARGYQYCGALFKFCPWCGKELIEDEKK